jgi:hypothetical protein
VPLVTRPWRCRPSLCLSLARLLRQSKDAFYHLSLPVELRPFFCMKKVRACDVHVTEVETSVPAMPGEDDLLIVIKK